jgi:hypothetical protein
MPGQADLTERWWSAEMAPRLARHREIAAAVLRRKVGALREEIVAALERRDSRAGGAPAPAAREHFAATRAVLEAADRRIYDLVFAGAPEPETLLSSAAGALAAGVADGELPVVFARELGRGAAEFGARFEALLRETRTQVEQALSSAAAPLEPGSLAPIAARPLFDPTQVVRAAPLAGAWRRWPVAGLRRAALRARLRRHFAAVLEDALRTYGHALARWAHLYLAELTDQFNTAAGGIEVRTLPAANAPGAGASAGQVAADLEELRQWNSRPAA